MTGLKPDRLVVIGAGPAGMAAALEAVRHGAAPVVVERLDTVGGLARTVARGGQRYDIGPHRFFTLNDEVRRLFAELCGPDLRQVKRITRIFYRGRYFNYPLTPFNALFGLGMIAALRALASYVAAGLRRRTRPAPIETFEDWVVDRFGHRLYATFFKTYTEKVWGIPCQRIGASWAGQRIKGLSLLVAIRNAWFPHRKGPRTLADAFFYPRLGAGQLYDKMRARVVAGGGEVRLGTETVRLRHRDFRIVGVDCRDAAGAETALAGDFYLSSAPLTDLVAQLDPPAPDPVRDAAAGLRYRHHIGVKLCLEGGALFPDNWIYVHSPDLRMARISDYANFSPDMSGAPTRRPLTVEYFCSPGDDLWQSPDDALIARAVGELRRMGLAPGRVADAFVVRSEKAYPVIEIGSEDRIATIKAYLDRFENLLPIGRSGMFKYNNQDHAIATGLYAARTALGLGRFDPWLVNIDGLYQESGAFPDHVAPGAGPPRGVGATPVAAD